MRQSYSINAYDYRHDRYQQEPVLAGDYIVNAPGDLDDNEDDSGATFVSFKRQPVDEKIQKRKEQGSYESGGH
jgi:hypothetical protein